MLTKKNLIKSEENLNKLCHKLNSLFIFLDEVYHINSGGCCYVASVLAELLEEDNIDYSTIVYDCDYDNFYDISCSCYHYAIRIIGAEEYCSIINGYDEDECDTFSEFEGVTAMDLLDHYKECSWNNYYNIFRNKYIKGLITKFYKDFTYDLRKEQSESNSK